MSYTNTWSDTRPLGSAQASTADDEMRTIRQDIHERMDSITEGWTADPVLLDQSKIGGKEGKEITIHGTAFQFEQGGSGANLADSGITTISNSAEPMRYPLILPPGVTITQIDWIVTGGDTADLVLSLKSLNFTVSLGVDIEHTMTDNVAGIDNKSSGTIAIPITGDKAYFLHADKTGGADYQIHAVKITYTTPDARNTI